MTAATQATMLPLPLLLLLLLAAAADVVDALRPARRPADTDAFALYPGGAGGECPCANKSLCEPINGPPLARKEVFGFNTGGGDFKDWNWTSITTVAWADTSDLTCFAHSKGARAVLPTPTIILTANKTAQRAWAQSVVAIVQSHFADGVTFDYESPIPAGSKLSAYYAQLIAETRAALHKANPSYQVTTCVAWSPDSIDGRAYPITALAAASDALYVMDYDTRSQIFDACLASANAPYPGMVRGMSRYMELGVPADKLILGVPWYGYRYKCLAGTGAADRYCPIEEVPFRGVNCSDAAGSEIELVQLLNLANITQRGYDTNMGAPWFNTYDGTTVHQLWYDNPTSLSLKYRWARANGVRGVGPFTWNDLSPTSTSKLPVPFVRSMWATFDDFTGA